MLNRLFLRKALSRWLLSALLLQLLMPAIASVRPADGARWIEVCVSSGVKWVQMDDGSGIASSHSTVDHCMLCATTGGTPEFDVRRYLSDVASDNLSLPSDRSTILIFSAFQRQSRAPPRFS